MAGALPRLTYTQIIAGRIPGVFMWGASVLTLICWPHVIPAITNRMHNAPKINHTYI